MTTSGITDWPLIASDIVTHAMYELGALSQGEEPTGEEMEDGILRLNGMIRSWSGEGNLFREETVEITVTAGTAQVTLDPSIRAVAGAWFQGSYNRIMAAWNRSQFMSLPTPSQTGTPIAFYVETGISGLKLSLWPVPSADCVIILDCSRQVQTVTDPSETVDVPEEWQEALFLGLASRLGGMFGVAETAPAKLQRIDARAQELYQRLLDRDRPDSYIFEPDY